MPVVLIFWAFGYLWKGKGYMKVSDIDVHSGMREHDWDEIRRINLEHAAKPVWRRFLSYLF
jgi:amino acid transporter